jgi:hypothetical protein
VEAAEEGLLLGESAEYAASQAHRPTPIPMTVSQQLEVVFYSLMLPKSFEFISIAAIGMLWYFVYILS